MKKIDFLRLELDKSIMVFFDDCTLCDSPDQDGTDEVFKVYATIFACFETEDDSEIGEEINIGHIKGYIVDNYIFDDPESYAENFDDVSEDMLILYRFICDYKKKLAKPDPEKVLIGDRLEIAKEYRNMGIGAKVLKTFHDNIKRLTGHDISLVLHNAQAYEFEGDARAKAELSLINFYKRQGFKSVNPRKDKTFMMKRL